MSGEVTARRMSLHCRRGEHDECTPNTKSAWATACTCDCHDEDGALPPARDWSHTDYYHDNDTPAGADSAALAEGGSYAERVRRQSAELEATLDAEVADDTAGPVMPPPLVPGKRRQWTDKQKRAIVAEALTAGAGAVAEKYQLHHTMLTRWRHEIDPANFRSRRASTPRPRPEPATVAPVDDDDPLAKVLAQLRMRRDEYAEKVAKLDRVIAELEALT